MIFSKYKKIIVYNNVDESDKQEAIFVKDILQAIDKCDKERKLEMKKIGLNVTCVCGNCCGEINGERLKRLLEIK